YVEHTLHAKRGTGFPAEGRKEDTVQCGWYRGFYLDNFRPGILMYPGAFCFLRGAGSERRKKNGICNRKERITDTGTERAADRGDDRKRGAGKRSCARYPRHGKYRVYHPAQAGRTCTVRLRGRRIRI